MKITIESTDQIVELLVRGISVPARLWKGTTDKGADVMVFVTRISVGADKDQAEFERELQETPATRAEEFWQVFPTRLVL